MSELIRPVLPQDEAAWRDLWDGYNRFYEHELPEEITQSTWSRLLDPNSPMHGIVIEANDRSIIGFANYVLHDSTWQIEPVCYLEDLYVDLNHRAGGVGRRFIDWLLAEMKSKHWAEVYWITRENNYRARALYDTYTPHGGYVRYALH